MLFADGSVHFISQNIAQTNLDKMSRYADGQVLGEF
jgi:hypothetical protein